MIGFEVETEDAEPKPELLAGQAEEKPIELTPQQRIDLFVGLVERMRSLGAVEVRFEEMRVAFPSASPPSAPAVLRVPLSPPPKREEPPLEAYDGEVLTPEDRERRAEHRRIKQLLGGV